MLKKVFLLVGVYSMLTLFLVACGRTTDGSGNTGSGNQVQMNDTQFGQSSVTIKKGESITLLDTTFTPHIIANGTWDNGQARPSRGRCTSSERRTDQWQQFEYHWPLHNGWHLQTLLHHS